VQALPRKGRGALFPLHIVADPPWRRGGWPVRLYGLPANGGGRSLRNAFGLIHTRPLFGQKNRPCKRP